MELDRWPEALANGLAPLLDGAQWMDEAVGGESHRWASSVEAQWTNDGLGGERWFGITEFSGAVARSTNDGLGGERMELNQ